MNISIVSEAKQANAITHGGIFHADEVMATVILSKVFGKLTLMRTFNVPEELTDGTIVYDIGLGKFDHHQKGGNGCRENGVPYAACGLIWKEYGHHICNNCIHSELIWLIIDKNLIQGIDAADNGDMPNIDYPAQSMTFSHCISGFNPNWDSSESVDEAFLKAVSFAEIIFDNVLANAIAKAKAQDIVENGIENSEGHIMILDKFVPWTGAIFVSSNPKAKDILFVVYPSSRGGYNWQAVPDALGSFGQRKPVPAKWKGLRGSDIQKVTGISTATFCHPAGFIGGAETLEDAIAIAKIAVSS